MIGVIVAVDAEFETAVVSRLAECDDIEVVSRPADEAELLAKAAVGAGRVALVSRYFTGLDGDVVAGLQRQGVHVLALGGDEDFAAWAVPSVDALADATTLAAAVRSCAANVQAPPKPCYRPGAKAEGKVLAVWGTGGAPGRSTVAAGVAHLAAKRAPALLVDADTVGASQAVLLGVLDDSPQLAALCRAASSGSLDEHAVRANSSVLGDGLALVTGMSRQERWAELGPVVLGEVLDELRGHAPVTVADISWRTDPDDEYADPHYDRHCATRAVLDACDHVLVVANADPLGLLRLINLATTPTFAEVAERTTIVVNKARASAVGADPERRVREVLTRFAGSHHVHVLPDARADVDDAVLAGRAVTQHVPRSPLSISLAELVDALPVMVPAAPKRPRTRRSGRRGSRRAARR